MNHKDIAEYKDVVAWMLEIANGDPDAHKLLFKIIDYYNQDPIFKSLGPNSVDECKRLVQERTRFELSPERKSFWKVMDRYGVDPYYSDVEATYPQEVESIWYKLKDVSSDKILAIIRTVSTDPLLIEDLQDYCQNLEKDKVRFTDKTLQEALRSHINTINGQKAELQKKQDEELEEISKELVNTNINYYKPFNLPILKPRIKVEDLIYIDQLAALINPPKNCLSPQMDSAIFYMCYSDRDIDQSREQEFWDDIELQEEIKAFGLNPIRYWYMCLYATDFIKHFDSSIKTDLSPVEELQQLQQLINDSGVCQADWNDPASNQIFELTPKRKGKAVDKYSINNPRVLTLLNYGIKEILDQIKDQKYKNPEFWEAANSGQSHSDQLKEELPKGNKLYLFKYYLQSYLTLFVEKKPTRHIHYLDKEGKNRKIQPSQSRLISKMIYYSGLEGAEYLDYKKLRADVNKVTKEHIIENRTANRKY